MVLVASLLLFSRTGDEQNESISGADGGAGKEPAGFSLSGLGRSDSRESLLPGVSWIIVDERTGALVEGARVKAFARNAMGRAMPVEVITSSLSVTVLVMAEGYLPMVRRMEIREAEPIILELRREGRVHLDLVGGPAPNGFAATLIGPGISSPAEAQALSADYDSLVRELAWAASSGEPGARLESILVRLPVGPHIQAYYGHARTEEGQLRFGGLAAGSYRYYIEEPRFARCNPPPPEVERSREPVFGSELGVAASGEFDVSDGQVVRLVCSMEHLAVLEGSIGDLPAGIQSAGVARATLRALQRRNGKRISSPIEQQMDLGNSRSFRFVNVLPGEKSIVITRHANAGGNAVAIWSAYLPLVEGGHYDLGVLPMQGETYRVEFSMDGEDAGAGWRRLGLEADPPRVPLTVSAWGDGRVPTLSRTMFMDVTRPFVLYGCPSSLVDITGPEDSLYSTTGAVLRCDPGGTSKQVRGQNGGTIAVEIRGGRWLRSGSIDIVAPSRDRWRLQGGYYSGDGRRLAALGNVDGEWARAELEVPSDVPFGENILVVAIATSSSGEVVCGWTQEWADIQLGGDACCDIILVGEPNKGEYRSVSLDLQLPSISAKWLNHVLTLSSKKERAKWRVRGLPMGALLRGPDGTTYPVNSGVPSHIVSVDQGAEIVR